MSVESIRDSWAKHDKDGSTRRMRTRAASGIRYASDDGVVQAEPSRVVTKFHTLDAGKSEHYKDLLPDTLIPGMGGLRDDCGDDIPRGCSGCGRTHTVGRTCYRSLCPRCWKGWARRRATTITSKLEGLRRYRESGRDGWQGWKFHHVVISPPPGYRLNRDNPLQATFDVLKEVMSEIGAEDGVLFYHPYRGSNGDDRGFWKNLLADGEEVDWNEVLEEIEYSPHFHAVVLAKWIETEHVVGYVEEQTGWTIHRITKSDESNVSLYDDYDLARSVSYCLSHTGIGEDRACYRYYGEVANFAATDKVKREMDARVRSVVPNTLGLELSSVACRVERTKKQTRTILVPREERVNLDAAMASANPEPQLVEEEITEEVIEECGGRMIEVTAFPRFLRDRRWTAKAPHAQDMARRWLEWRDRIDRDGGPPAEDYDRPPD